jgi:hypothetical protein
MNGTRNRSARASGHGLGAEVGVGRVLEHLRHSARETISRARTECHLASVSACKAVDVGKPSPEHRPCTSARRHRRRERVIGKQARRMPVTNGFAAAAAGRSGPSHHPAGVMSELRASCETAPTAERPEGAELTEDRASQVMPEVPERRSQEIDR